LEYTDTDGVVMKWDGERRAYFPAQMMDDTFLAKYQLGYGTASNTGNTWSKHHNEQGIPYYYNTATKASAWTLPEGATVVDTAAAQAATGTSMTGAATLTYEQLVYRKRIADMASGKEDGEAKPAKKAKKEEDKEGFFKADASKNPNVYVQGLPTDDFDDEAFVTFMSRCGIVMQGQDGTPKIKLYRNADGSLKGDARCCYAKVESVSLALQILDGTEISTGHTVAITRAVFEQKGEYNAALKPKKPKKKKGKEKKALDSKFGWHEETKEVSKKAAGVVVIKQMFHPKEFDEDATYLTDIRVDLDSECKTFGEIKKIMIFDRHPDGVVSIKFADVESAHRCVKVMNGRFFAGRKLEAGMWDGHTNYKIEESELEREERLKKWETDLG